MTDETRFRAFYQEMYPRLWSYVHRLVPDRVECDDIVQETFFRFLRTAPERLDEAGMKSYLYKTATNYMHDLWRTRRSHETWLSERFDESPADPKTDLRLDLNSALTQLSPGHRSLVWLAYVEGYDHKEIAEISGIKPESVRVLLLRARKRLAAILGDADSSGRANS